MIELAGLTKRYGNFTAVDDVTFTVPPGSVVGFLGPNGAGKSTAMRMLVGLTPPTAGTARVLGRDYKDLPNPGRHVGVMLDASAQHAGRTGREVLTLASMHLGMPKSRVDELLHLVSLDATEAKRRVRDYSLGMRQRLGLAVAMMGDPPVLILDEPANGLDPQGIHWMRGLLRGHAERGGTVLLSSHLLHEVEVIADELVVIGRGRILAKGDKRTLAGAQGTQVASTDDQALAAALGQQGLSVTSGSRPGEPLIVQCEPEQVGRIALASGIALTHLAPSGGRGLEEIFLNLTAEHDRANPTQPTSPNPGAAA